MRPVDKLIPGNHTLPDGSTLDIKTDYPNYRDAKPDLVSNLGTICSYCEKAFDDERDLDVEHIQPKKYKDSHGNYIYAHLETRWDNFLISCKTCNGKDNKDTKNVVYGDCHLPHLNNTFLSFVYKEGGVVEVNPELIGKSYDNAEALYNLVRLDKTPKTSRPGDKRWKIRMVNWNLANKYLIKYQHGQVDVDTIVDLVEGRGCWSIWFTVFIDHRDVRQALVDRFPGTSRCCFDADYTPIPKNPSNTTDSI